MTAPYADAGLGYHGAGWSPIPVGFDNKGRLHAGQKANPVGGWTGNGAPRPSYADVHDWATNGAGIANVGLRLHDDVVGIDVDNYGPKHGGQTLADLEERLGPLPATVRSTSRLDSDPVSGIRLFKVPPGLGWADPGEGIEVIHAGWRYVVAQPSLHPEGRDYVWIDDRTGVLGEIPSADTLPALPDAWIEHMRAKPGTLKDHIGNVEADEYLAALATGEPCRYLAGKLVEAGPALAGGGSRHDVLNTYVAKIVRGGDQGHRGAVSALETLRAAFAAVVGADSTRKPDEGEFRRSVVGAVGLVKATPTPETDTGCCGDLVDQHEEDLVDQHEGDLVDDLREGMHHGQLRIAYRLVGSHYRDKLMHVHGVGWHRWDGRRWAYDDQGHAVRAVRHVLRRALESSLDLGTDAANAIRRDVDTCSSANGARGVLALAASMAPFAATVHDLDADPYLLNTATGTLDLRTFQLRPHDPGDRITKVTTAAYRPGVSSVEWDRFLQRVLPNVEVRGFLQRLAGVALLGRVVEHVLGIATGEGANGKGVFTRAVEYALGDYASTAEADLFMAREGAHPTGEMDLLGLRWVTVSETDQGRRLAEATMKRLTGGDTIKARRMRQDFVEFRPSHTAVLVTNHLPAVRGDDPAIWRRPRCPVRRGHPRGRTGQAPRRAPPAPSRSGPGLGRGRLPGLRGPWRSGRPRGRHGGNRRLPVRLRSGGQVHRRGVLCRPTGLRGDGRAVRTVAAVGCRRWGAGDVFAGVRAGARPQGLSRGQNPEHQDPARSTPPRWG